MDYKEYNDYELLNYVSENNEDAINILYQKYQPFIHKISKKLYPYVKNSGMEMSDLSQEGLLGLTNAIQHFKEQKNTTFYTFATTCIERKMISSVIASKRLKNKILNDSIPIESVNDFGDSYSLENLLSDDTKNPEKLLLFMEYHTQLLTRASKVLTPFEQSVLELKLSGFDYKEIAEVLDKEYKAIDNALQRIKSKMRNQI